MNKLYREWEARMLRHVLGKRWKDSPYRFAAVGIIEKPEINPHIHCLIQIRADGVAEMHERMHRSLRYYGKYYWKRIVPAGTYDFQEVTDISGVARYMAKSLRRPKDFDRVLLPNVTLH